MAPGWNETPGTLMGGKRSHHSAIPVPSAASLFPALPLLLNLLDITLNEIPD